MPNTVISSSAVNSDLSDIATALTGSVSADGQTPITGPLKSGISASPAFTSSSDITTGFSSTTGEADIWVSGVKVMAAQAGTVTVTNNLTVTGAIQAASTAFTGTGAIQIPTGTTAQRPATPVFGDIRLNATTGSYEGYDGAEWLVMSSFNTAYSLSCTASSSLLTVSLLNALTGTTPTAVDPVVIRFRDVTGSAGDLVPVLVNSALTINTNGIGASLGSLNNVPFRFWIVAFNNSGTAVLGLINCSAATSTTAQIFPLSQINLASSTPISNAATSAGVFYTPNGTTVSGAPFTILGFLEYGSGLATAGTYSTAPSRVELYIRGVKLPGDIVQTIYVSNPTAVGNNTGTFIASDVAATITPVSSINLVQIASSAYVNNQSVSVPSTMTAEIRRGASTVIGQPIAFGVTVSQSGGISFNILDTPGTTSSTTYTIYFNSSTAAPMNVQNGTMILTELTG